MSQPPSLPASPPTSYDVLIVGAGMAGISTALWCRRLGLSFAWFEQAPDLGGQLAMVHNPIPDYPGRVVADGAELRAVLAAQLADQQLAPRLDERVASVDVEQRLLGTAEGQSYTSRALVIATGVERRRLGVTGERELTGLGVGASPRKDREAYADQPVAIVGGGDAACENALLLAETSSQVILIHRRATFRARAEWLEAIKAQPRIEVVTNARVKAVLGTEWVEGVRLDTPEGERTLAIRGLFVRIGVTPASYLVQRQVRCDPDGYVLVDGSQRSSDPWVYAAGDVCNPSYSSLAAAGGHGMVAAKAISLGA